MTNRANTQKDAEIAQMKDQIAHLKDEVAERDIEIAQKDTQITQKDVEITRKDEWLNYFEASLAERDRTISAWYGRSALNLERRA